MEEKVDDVNCENENKKTHASALAPARRGISRILPEIWERIFSDLSPTDFLSVINSWKEWNQLMHMKKTNFLFPLILPFVLEYLPLNSILLLASYQQEF
ncbi:unnamed protein product [Orchesella dallaii]|uniref:F-box domain-containing protein n=1 Tax=Orchesella dallaii TaxID=48710 RepID=A0ABP1SAC1_9HEXA